MPTNHKRLGRLRRSDPLRKIAREVDLSPRHLAYPIFVAEAATEPRPIKSMPGISQLPIGAAEAEAREVLELGIPAIMIFGIPERKDDQASGAAAPDGIVQRTIRTIKDAYPELLVVADVCLCQYMSHGHCGVINAKGEIENDATLELLAQTAVSYAQAGADVVAPSDMMDGRVLAIRRALDSAGFHELPILSYAAKFASSFYGPFREAAESSPEFGDRSSYQLDPANLEEAVREAETDVQEGADMVMVKPALPYLDVLRAVRQAVSVPVAAYNVSGEYAMLKAAADAGHLDEERVVLEALLSIRRAGADLIFTYHAKDAARWLQ